MRVLGINAVFHDPAAALVVDGKIVAAAEEERFSRRKHGKRPVPFSTWELPELSARWRLEYAGLTPADLDDVLRDAHLLVRRPGVRCDPTTCRVAAERGAIAVTLRAVSDGGTTAVTLEVSR